eukprot:TRINITY_DN4543_c0_g2_i1.p1 TRINITY_DN4543_c0_g2~~TRINITY_DN4543_c0_g2_i1.p1  ORF type:complete len:678 (+),score=120.26 TRINITY_DN4543_c0_g2_i1:49-2082(+)
MDHFIVLVPCDKNKDPTVAFKEEVGRLGLRQAKVNRFPIPDLKVGTLDHLMECSDELHKLDSNCEMMVQKLLTSGESLEFDATGEKATKAVRLELMKVIEKTDRGEKSKPARQYLESWSWNQNKYTNSSKESLKKVLEDLYKPILKAEDTVKRKLTDYSEIKGKAQSAEKRVKGNLTMKDITQHVREWNRGRPTPFPEELLSRKAKDCDGTKLCMLFVAISKRDKDEWDRHASWGLSEEDVASMANIDRTATDNASDGVSITNIKFFQSGTEVSLANAHATSPDGSQSGYGDNMDTGAPSNAIDGSALTAWFEANRKPLIVEFSSPTAVDSFSLMTGREAPHRDPISWKIEGYTAAPPGTKPPTRSITVGEVGTFVINKGQSEASFMRQIHEKANIPFTKRINLREVDDDMDICRAEYDLLTGGGSYTYTITDLKDHNKYSTKEITVDLGKWETLYVQEADFKMPTERRREIDPIRLSKPGTYTKYRFTPLKVRGRPLRGKIPCGNGSVPGTSEVVADMGDHLLMSVMVFSQLDPDFRHKCRERKFAIREYEPLEETGGRTVTPQHEFEKLEEKRLEKLKSLKNDIAVQFSEAYTSWVHIKAVRAFVEAILRYGLPAKYTSMIISCESNKAHDEMRSKLSDHYRHLSPNIDFGEETNDSNALQERFPYVSLRVPDLE